MHQIASQGILISKNFRGSLLVNPPRKLDAFGHSGLLQTILLDRTLVRTRPKRCPSERDLTERRVTGTEHWKRENEEWEQNRE